MRHNEPVAGAIRALPQPERSNALRSMLLNHFGNVPGVVCSRRALEARASSSPPTKRKPTAAGITLALVVALLTFAPFQRAAAGTWNLDANLASIHTERWARDSLNQRNPGIGIEFRANRDWAFTGGIYSNSYRKPTVYALVEYTPLHIGQISNWHVDAGVAAGLASGYSRTEVPCAPLGGGALLRIASPGGVALNLIGVPNTGAYQSGFVGFQLVVPLSR